MGPYTVVRFVARGGAGEVYEAEEKRAGRMVALLVNPAGQNETIDISYPGLLNCVVGRLADVHYYALEFVEAVPWTDLLNLRAPKPVDLSYEPSTPPMPPEQAPEFSFEKSESPSPSPTGKIVRTPKFTTPLTVVPDEDPLSLPDAMPGAPAPTPSVPAEPAPSVSSNVLSAALKMPVSPPAATPAFTPAAAPKVNIYSPPSAVGGEKPAKSPVMWAIEGLLVFLIALAAIATIRNLAGTSEPPPQPQAPAAPARPVPTSPSGYWLKPGESPLLAWAPLLSNGFRLEIATTPAFAEKYISEAVTGNSYKVMRDFEEGRYYWRLFDEKLRRSFGPFEMKISKTSPPRILAPLPGQVIDIPASLPSVQVTFAWRCKPGATRYRAQIADYPDFTKPLQDVTLAGCKWPEVNLTAGTHYLRVRTEIPTGDMNSWSNPVYFKVEGGLPPSRTPAARR